MNKNLLLILFLVFSFVSTACEATQTVVIGSNVQAYDADLDDLADGTLTGSKVGIGINGENISDNTIDDDSIDFGTGTDQVSASDMPDEDLGDISISSGVWSVDIAGASTYDTIEDPENNSTIAFAGFVNSWTTNETGSDFFNITNSGNFGDVSLFVIQSTGNPTNGTMLEIINTDADVDSIIAPNFSLTQSGVLTSTGLTCTDCIDLGSETTGNYVTAVTTSVLTGLTGGNSAAEGTTSALALDYSQTIGGNPALAASATIHGATGIIFEGTADDTIEGLLTAPTITGSDKTWTLPNTTGTIYVTSGTDVSVADGGTGRSTSTTAYGLIAAGTTATGAHQTLAAGATTEILVGGGASALPVWTTATGSNAPVRGTSPTIATPILTGKIDRNNVAVDDDDCTGEQGLYWYDTTDSAFEFCNANSGTPTVLGAGGSSDVYKTLIVFDFGTPASTGDGKFYFPVQADLNSKVLSAVHAQVITAGTTNTLDVQLVRCAAVTSGNACSGTVADMLSTKLTVDSGEDSSDTAATAAVINTSNDDVSTNQVIRVDIDAVQTTESEGLIITLKFT